SRSKREWSSTCALPIFSAHGQLVRAVVRRLHQGPGGCSRIDAVLGRKAHRLFPHPVGSYQDIERHIMSGFGFGANLKPISSAERSEERRVGKACMYKSS